MTDKIELPDVDWLANVIRSADGNHSLGAGELAEKIISAIAADRANAESDVSKSHQWDEDGERCLKCGDKDWMASPTCNASKPADEVREELESMTRMFHAACADLGQINEALGLDPDDGGAEPILDAIEELKVAADRAKRAHAVTDEQIQEIMFAVFDYASIADGIESATFGRRDQQRAKMFAQDRKSG